MSTNNSGSARLGPHEYEPHTQFAPRARSGAVNESRLVRALTVVDALLLVLFIVVLVSVVGGSSSKSPTQNQATQTPSGPDASQGSGTPDTDISEITGAQTFSTPTGNIVCTISSEGVQCSIARLAKDPVQGTGDCTGYVGYVAELRSTGPTLPCVEAQDLPGGANDSLPVLDYGKKQTVNNYECESLRTGMKCYDINNNRGFNVARAGITTF